MNIVLNDTLVGADLYPFGLINALSNIRVGILSIKERWQLITGAIVFDNIETFLQTNTIEQADIIINANIIITKQWWQQNKTAVLLQKNITNIDDSPFIKTITYPWQIFQYNDWATRSDFELITSKCLSQPIPTSNKVIMPNQIFIEEGAIVENTFLNAATGPIYIGKNAEIMDGSMIRGPFALCENAVLKMGSKVYGATTIGPNSIAAGEIKNSILFANSNKAHDGYLGDSVIGEWCNLGAGTTNSNVKNTASIVKVWHQASGQQIPVGNKCGLIMGDYSRAAINTAFNTGTVVGVCCNIFGSNYPPKHVASFSWGNQQYFLLKALEDINNWKTFKGKLITQTEKDALSILYNQITK
jgi:UDP-N-acetylglucosamine diphosphorylase / glucose-1-phosphate thymidylyltransferase / UDP-N-acetylgalactosamine diphosphorylase / glucosamine-1-phosphate N-acetyltransferase / galactosamine-1-phosphate N-acetyltransferase